MLFRSMEAVLYKLDGQGGSVWSRRWNGTGGVLGRALAVGAGSVVVAGNYRGEVDGDPGVGERVLGTEGGVEGFLVKLDSAGTYGWSHRFGGSGDESLTSVAVDERGGVYVGGMFHGEVDLDPGSGAAKQVANGGGEEGFVVKLESTGAYAWSKVFGGAADDHVQSVAVDRTGDVYLGGYYSGVVDFDPGMGEAVSASSGGLDAFVVKLTTTGTIRVDTQAPQVAGVSRRMPLEASVTATSVAYRVRFSREVSGVDAGDFSVTTTGGLTGEVTAVAAVNASEYVVVAGNLKGSGTVRLDLKGSGTGITDLSGNALTGGYTQGETYTVTAATTQPELGGSASAGGIYGSTFNYTVTASRAPQGYTAVGLPSGLSINPASGVISGTPRETGVFAVGLGALNLGGQGQGVVVVTVGKAPLKVTAVDASRAYGQGNPDRKSTRLNSSHVSESRMPSSA